MKQKTRRRLQNIGVLLLIAAGLAWVAVKFLGFTNPRFTDNAQVQRLIVPVNSRISGYIEEVRFTDFQFVQAGDTLVIIDDAEYRLQVAKANGDLSSARSQHTVTGKGVKVTENNIRVDESSIAEAEANFRNAETELKRYQELVKAGGATQQQLDQKRTEYEALKARVQLLNNQRQTTNLSRDEQISRVDLASSSVEIAQSQLDLARLNLSYTVVTAPCSGWCSKRAIQPGQLVQPGQQLLEIVDAADVWVVANFREKQISHIAVGDSVTVTVDALPGIDYRGVVAILSQATGAGWQPEQHNYAVGNFVKIEQRVPVRIRLIDCGNSQADLNQLRSGMNAEVKILRTR